MTSDMNVSWREFRGPPFGVPSWTKLEAKRRLGETFSCPSAASTDDILERRHSPQWDMHRERRQ